MVENTKPLDKHAFVYFCSVVSVISFYLLVSYSLTQKDSLACPSILPSAE